MLWPGVADGKMEDMEMIVLSGMQIHRSFSTQVVLRGVTMALHEGDRVGVVGANGSGKSTLLRILAGFDRPDSGSVALGKGATIGYLAQDLFTEELGVDSSPKTVYEEALSGRADLLEMAGAMRRMESEMALMDESSDGLHDLMATYADQCERYEHGGGMELESRTKMILAGLGISEEDQGKPLAALSGGERTMVGLAKILVQEPDILLLDEPTNHLDANAVGWLEGYLGKYRGSVMAVSHDRYFLDRVVSKILEIEGSQTTEFPGSYSDYSDEKRIRLLEQQHNFLDQQKEIARLTASMTRMYAWARQVYSRGLKLKGDHLKRRIERIEKIPKPKMSASTIGVDFKPTRRSGEVVLTCKGLAVDVGTGGPLFRNVNLDLRYGQHIAVVGPNGCGKSTLIRTLIGEVLPCSGEAVLGASVTVGYYDQRHEGLDMARTALEEIMDFRSMAAQAGRALLARFGLTGSDVLKKVADLSGGERSRLQLAKLMVTGANFLILDEPTNHLDPKTVETLEDALDAYEGTILFVSHDRYFVNALADKVLELTEHGIREYLGNYDSYAEAKAEEAEAAKRPQVTKPAPQAKETRPKTASSKKRAR